MTDAQETTPALGWMAAREAAAGICDRRHYSFTAASGRDPAKYQSANSMSRDEIRALPAPTSARLLAEAMRPPEVVALVEWLRAKTRDIETHETMYDDARADIFVGEILERLAAIKEASHANG